MAFAVLLLLFGCAHGQPEMQRAKCPDSEKAGLCNSGPLVCKLDEKRGCDLCQCERVVF